MSHDRKIVVRTGQGAAPSPWRALITTSVLSVSLKLTIPMHGQEAVRPSLAGETAAEARHQGASAPQSYNLSLGPVAWTLGAALDFEADDNIAFTSADRVFDLITRPQITTRALWPVTYQNTLNFALSAGYSAYARHSQFNRLFVAPGSELSFDLYVGDLWLNVHERLSITENAYEDPTVVGSADYSQLQNVAGLAATWDLNHIVVGFGYDHTEYLAVTDGGGLPDGNSDILALSATYQWSDTTRVGLESGGGWIRYDGEGTPASQAADLNVGAIVELRPLQYVTLRAAAGYCVYSPLTATSPSEQEFTGAYAQVDLHHRINRFLEYDLSGGRNISFGFFAGTMDLCSARWEATWRLFQKLNLSTGFEYEHGSQVLSGSETFDRFGPRITLQRPITAKMSGALRYQFYQRCSETAGGDYVLNLVTLSLAYRL